MRRFVAWGAGVALLLGAGTAGADPGPGGGAGGNWLTRWFRPAGNHADRDPGTRVQKGSADPTPAAVRGPTVVEAAATVRAREEAKYTRRLEVCDRLKEVADLTNDGNLRRRAELLEERAWEVYTERTRHLPAAQVLFDSDRAALQKHLGAGDGAGRRAATLYNVPSTDRRSAAKEER